MGSTHSANSVGFFISMAQPSWLQPTYSWYLESYKAKLIFTSEKIVYFDHLIDDADKLGDTFCHLLRLACFISEGACVGHYNKKIVRCFFWKISIIYCFGALSI